MNFKEYQKAARATAIYPHTGMSGYSYVALGLNGEAGEVAEQVKKAIRDDGEITLARKMDLMYELGDVLWYVANLAEELDLDMETIAKTNIDKLASRQERGVLKGDGDYR